MKAYVVFSRPKPWWMFLDQVFMWVEGTNFSHVAIVLEDLELGKHWVYESKAPKGRKIALEKWLHGNKIVKMELIDSNFNRYSNHYYDLIRMTDKPYSFKQVVTIGWGLVFKATGSKDYYLELNGNRAKICTELVAMFLNRVYGVKLKKSPDLIGLYDVKLMVDDLKKR